MSPTLVEALASKIIELPSEAPSPQVQSDPSKMDVDPPSVINTFILGKSAKADNIVCLGDPENWNMNNQSSGYDLYVHFVALSSVSCMAQCKRKFVLFALPIIENLCRCDKALCTICKGKEVPYGCSYNDEWFLDSSTSAHFTPFEFNFVSMT